MAEIRNGLRHFLARPKLYDGFQHLVGAYSWRRKVINDLVAPILTVGDRFIDIGCGTGDILQCLPHDVSYFGFDRNPAYIEAARSRFFDRDARFECESVGQESSENYPKFDVAIAFGLMHHLDDADVIKLLQTARNVLTEEGVLFLLDPVFVSSQSKLARFIVSKDRGQNVRTLDGYRELCKRVFSCVEYRIDMRPMLIPYTGIVITCSSK